jgi:sigma-B regulation protein RsbU (phosphoserine phosphatase)
MIPSLPLTAKILMIDDDAAFREVAKEYFEDSGFILIGADNGEEGLALFRSEKPDVVINDLQMPGLNGLEVLKILTKEAPETPVVVLSEAGGLEDVIQALRIGAWDYLTKPMTQIPVLEHAVCRALEQSRLVEENKLYRRELEAANLALKKNLDILEQDQEAGRSVQMRLLPEQGIQFGSYRFHHHIAPSLFLSGDFVDYFKINEDLFGFYIADVSGHGASSAFVTVLLKSIMSQMLTRYQAQQDDLIIYPEKVLAKLAGEIYEAKLGKYLTMVYGVVDWKKNQLTYSVGGHYPNPVLLENGKSRFLEGQGFPVGILKKTEYQRLTLEISQSAKLLMFSDGIAEILPEKDMASKEQLLLSMASAGEGTIDHFIQQLGLDNKKGLPDDVTILTLWNGL